MKTASIPSLRVDTQLREAAIEVLNDGETLSSFVTLALRESIDRRRHDADFLARGISARDTALTNHDTVAASRVIEKLEQLLANAKSKGKRVS